MEESIKSAARWFVIASDECIPRLSTITVVPLTSNPRDKVRDLLDVMISANSPAGKAGGLRQDSVAACTFVYSYPKDWVVAKIGTLPKEVVDEICKQVAKLIEPSK
ncbi:MAG: type II toxin-antitoxin system PemK/MazF family toxin [Candidatus Melainabacteria bacterium]|nr:type II toxin-antitoxin system PemK/MazF family toxin [Candidatus Melainabacteria bacterium]